jgi:hypothetical protein
MPLIIMQRAQPGILIIQAAVEGMAGGAGDTNPFLIDIDRRQP